MLTDEILLNDGDSIFIPKITNVISVVGEVINPTSFVSDGNLNMMDVISRGGGYRETADRGNTYIISSDGSIKKSSRNLFSGNFSVSPGDTIVVPRKMTQSGLEIITPISQILSNLAFSAAAIDNLKSN
jgi:protein involved in polysaccharide export with SLBB domain